MVRYGWLPTKATAKTSGPCFPIGRRGRARSCRQGLRQRLAVRYARSLIVFQAFVHIACLMIVLWRVLK